MQSMRVSRSEVASPILAFLFVGSCAGQSLWGLYLGTRETLPRTVRGLRGGFAVVAEEYGAPVRGQVSRVPIGWG